MNRTTRLLPTACNQALAKLIVRGDNIKLTWAWEKPVSRDMGKEAHRAWE